MGTHLERIWNGLERIWNGWGPFWNAFGTDWNAFGTILNTFGTHLKRLGTYLEHKTWKCVHVSTFEGPMSINLTIDWVNHRLILSQHAVTSLDNTFVLPGLWDATNLQHTSQKNMNMEPQRPPRAPCAPGVAKRRARHMRTGGFRVLLGSLLGVIFGEKPVFVRHRFLDAFLGGMFDGILRCWTSF